MKFLALVTALIVTHVMCSSSFAQVFYQSPSASTIEPGRVVAGPHVAIGEDLFRVGGYVRVGLATYWDFGAEVVADAANGDWRAGAAGDLKLRVFPTTKALPFDLSLVAGLGFVAGDNTTVVHVPIGGIISGLLKRDGGQAMTPYLGVYAVIVNTDIDIGTLTTSKTEVDPSIRGGLSVEFTDRLDFFGAFQLAPDNQPHGGNLISFGVTFKL